jgi:hypothetical protein
MKPRLSPSFQPTHKSMCVQLSTLPAESQVKRLAISPQPLALPLVETADSQTKYQASYRLHKGCRNPKYALEADLSSFAPIPTQITTASTLLGLTCRHLFWHSPKGPFFFAGDAAKKNFAAVP